jgi:hypothetical protein
MHALTFRALALFLIAAFFLPDLAAAQNQTNDPLVGQQQYLFDVHRVDQAWNYTTGSSNVTVGLYSMLGFIQNHEDLATSRLKSPVGSLLEPELDVASQMAGVVGATTNNSVGMAGVDRTAQLQSYSVLTSTEQCPSGCKEEEDVTFTRPDGTTETYYLDMYRFSDLIDQGSNNGVDVHLLSFGLPSGLALDWPISNPDINPFNLSTPPSPTERLRNELSDAFDRITSSFCGSNCTSPPDPVRKFYETVGSAAANDDGIVVGAAGDLNEDGDMPPAFSPGLLDPYAVTVGGIELNASDQRVPWDNTRPAPYVDVAAFAKDVVGVSGTGSDQYDTDFTGTAASASIGAGVASLLRAEMPSLSSEDVEEILRRTARDAGAPGEDNATGTGAIDAGAALSYVRNNDVQRSKQPVNNVTSDQVVNSGVELYGSGYWSHVGQSCGNGPLTISGDLHKFTAKVPYSQTFSSAPDTWVRWAKSNGFQSIRGSNKAWYDPYQQDLQVISADRTGLTVEGYYWTADFYNSYGQRCAKDIPIPKKPGNFKIGYTAVGTEGAPPLDVSLSGPTWLDTGEQGTWTASVSGGSGSASYDWEYQSVPSSTGWYSTYCSGASCSHTFFNYSSSQVEQGKIRVTVTKGSEQDQVSRTVNVNPAGGYYSSVAKRRTGAFQALDASADGGGAAEVRWSTRGPLPAAEFVVEHRRDSTAAWTEVGRVAAADSVGAADRRRGASYRYRADGLSVGTHQFRLQAQRKGAKKAFRSRPVSAEIRLKEAYEVTTYPNPVRTQTTVEVAVKERQAVTVAVYDILGRRVTTLHKGPLPAQDARRFRLRASETGLSSGTYFVRVRGKAFADTRRLTVVR